MISRESNEQFPTGISKDADKNLIYELPDGIKTVGDPEQIHYSVKGDGGVEYSFIVPAKTLNEVTKLIEDSDETITLNIGKKYILFEVGNYRIVSRLLEGEFFNYKNAVPSDNSTKARVNVKQLINSVDRASLLITSKIKSPVRCVFEDN